MRSIRSRITDHYIEYCIERGFLPMFFEFSMNPNYYKDIFDFNVFDRKSYNPRFPTLWKISKIKPLTS